MTSPRKAVKTAGRIRAGVQRLVFLGPPGSGKGTAASWISRRLKISHVSTGEIFRHEIASLTRTGKLMQRFMARGQLVPDDVVTKMVDRWLGRHGIAGFAFDGFPRTLPQGRLFRDLLRQRGLALDAVVYLNASRSVVEEHVLGRRVCEDCGENFHLQNRQPRRKGICDLCDGRLVRRPDDSLKMLQRRWAVFEEQTAGLVDFYREPGLLIEVDSNCTPERMCRRVWEAIT